jgi:ELWxxDGT repeat protein
MVICFNPAREIISPLRLYIRIIHSAKGNKDGYVARSSPPRRRYPSAIMFLVAFGAAASQAYLVKEFVGGVSSSYAVAHNQLFFSGFDESYGAELWQSDGTAAGTMRVSDIGPVGIPRAITDIQGTAFILTRGADLSALWPAMERRSALCGRGGGNSAGVRERHAPPEKV